MKYRTLSGETLDMIVWKHYDSLSGNVEKVLEANPGLAAHGPLLPENLIIELPSATTDTATQTIRLWD